MSPAKSKTAIFNKRRSIETRASLLESSANNSDNTEHNKRHSNLFRSSTNIPKQLNNSNKGGEFVADKTPGNNNQFPRRNTMSDYTLRSSKQVQGVLSK